MDKHILRKCQQTLRYKAHSCIFQMMTLTFFHLKCFCVWLYILDMLLFLGQFKQKVSVYDMFGKPVITPADNSNPWWTMLEEAIRKANVKLGKPEIFPASTDSRYFRERGIPAFGFSPMANTPILLHDHNEVWFFVLIMPLLIAFLIPVCFFPSSIEFLLVI